ncbi:MAG: hypothetical protein U9Q81_01100 [Pseudomonadota bacterium]|nr:hypothetical protein [Pseudomonadota bacterium]
MDLRQAAARIKAAGVVMRVKGGRLAIRSRTPLTDRQRAFFRDHKTALLRLLTRPSVTPVPDLTDEERQAIEEAVAERAAIQEFDGGLSRAEAERQARVAMRVFRYRLTDAPGTWHALICPGCELDQAKAVLTLRFGPGAVAEVLEHRHDLASD